MDFALGQITPEHGMSLKLQERPWSFSDRIMRNLSTHERGELKTFLFLIQLDDWQAVDAENGGDFAAMMDVVLEHTPDDLLARHRGSHLSRLSRRRQPHLGEWLERRLDLLRVTHTFRLIQRRDVLEKISRGQAGNRLLDHLPGLFQSGHQFSRRVEWINVRLTDSQSP